MRRIVDAVRSQVNENLLQPPAVKFDGPPRVSIRLHGSPRSLQIARDATVPDAMKLLEWIGSIPVGSGSVVVEGGAR